jgi:rhodanese-related sulfurtransferase
VWPFSRGAAAAFAEVDVREAYERRRNGARLIDVRSAEEFRSGHPRGAVNIPPQRLESATAGYRRDGEILLICQSGHRSATATRQLAALGFTGVANVRGGLNAWRRAGLPVSR